MVSRNNRVAHDLGLAERVELLAEWARLTKRKTFSHTLIRLVEDRIDDFSPWVDGADLPGLLVTFRGGRWRGIDDAKTIASGLEKVLIKTISRADTDDLNRILRSLEQEDASIFSPEVFDAFKESVQYEITRTKENIDQMESETDVEDYVKTLGSLAKWSGLDMESVEEMANERVEDLRSTTFDYVDPEFPKPPRPSPEFDDEQLKNLFASLLS